MAVITANSWVLGGISVLNDGKAGWVRLGSLYQGQAQAPTIPFSMRHPSMGCQVRFTEPVQRQDHVDNLDVGHAAPRAGRLVSLAGVLLQSPRLAASAFWPATSKRKSLSRCYRASKRTMAGKTRRTLIRGF
ncbi:MAG: hypothetical protein ACJ8FY_23820 [Gemmataceae bacterium]